MVFNAEYLEDESHSTAAERIEKLEEELRILKGIQHESETTKHTERQQAYADTANALRDVFLSIRKSNGDIVDPGRYLKLLSGHVKEEDSVLLELGDRVMGLSLTLEKEQSQNTSEEVLCHIMDIAARALLYLTIVDPGLVESQILLKENQNGTNT